MAQGKQDVHDQQAPLQYAVLAQDSGYIHTIDNIASLAGAPIDKLAGIDLSKKVGEKVNKGDTLFTIYACFKSELEFAKKLADEGNVYTIKAKPSTKTEQYFI